MKTVYNATTTVTRYLHTEKKKRRKKKKKQEKESGVSWLVSCEESILYKNQLQQPGIPSSVLQLVQ